MLAARACPSCLRRQTGTAALHLPVLPQHLDDMQKTRKLPVKCYGFQFTGWGKQGMNKLPTGPGCYSWEQFWPQLPVYPVGIGQVTGSPAPPHHPVDVGKYEKHWFNIYLQLFRVRCQQDWFRDMGLSDDHMLLTGLFILHSAQWWPRMTFLMEIMQQSELFSVLSMSQEEGFFVWTSLSMAIPIHSGDFSVTHNDCRHWCNILLFPRKAGIETCSFLCLHLLLYPCVTAAVFKGWTEGWASSGFHRHQYWRVSCRFYCIDLIFLL